jgi:ketosteroid isomerase-like protein
MSEENVETLQRLVAAWDSDDLSEWATALHEEITWVPLLEYTETEPVHGVEATLAFAADWIEPWEKYSVELLGIIDAGDWAVMSTRQSGTLPTGAEVTIEMHAAAAFRGGKLIEIRWFMSEADAREAAGLSQ